ncbi:TonB-dependent receptor [Pelomonas cellulosilytica]|uniref:TonB-dependent receptor n=1 Tax=Pelomonas cellulosilytica TaxID=2906762 RepID=A0ABS8XVE9_9BURK|nr:TonB-dependent receptor [Pelomonas sp. P8]MCE4555198.1 TonB-dependent receptor [Pelomonas sp. P8]
MSIDKHACGAAPTQATFRIRPVAVGCALLIAAAAVSAQQQTQQLETVTITGIRKGIEAAISVKKNADNIVESVSAEDIGKLPDVSIAESIARLPGLSAQRVAGRAQVISVRGLSPDFATSLLNGRELVSTGDNRSVEFDQYPSELLAGVNVYKTPDAGLVGQGLSGTIDMNSVRPLNFGSRVVALNVRGQRNSLGAAAGAKATGNRFSASYIDQFADRSFGLVLGYAHQETPVQEEQVGLYEPWSKLGDGSRPGVAAGTYYSDGIKALRRTGITKRDAFLATAEFRPTKDFTSVVDYYHTKAHQEDTANQFEVNLSGYNGNYTPGLSITSPVVNGNNTFVGGTASGLYPLVRGMYNDRHDTIDAFGWNNKLKLAGGGSLTADVSYSKADREEVSLENNAQLPPVGSTAPLDTLKFNFATGSFPTLVPTLSYADPTKLFLRGTIYGSGYGKTPSVKDELKSIKLAGNFPLPESMKGLFQDVDVGLNYADRSKKKHQPEGNINVGSQGDTAIASDLQYAPVDLSFAGVGMIPAWNVPAAVAKYMTFNPSETSAPYLIPKAWNVYEKTTTAFVKGNIDSEWAGLPVRGNLGLQVVRTDQSSTSNYWDSNAPSGSNVKLSANGKVRTDVLPSLNLAFSLADDQTLRLAVARQMARPRVDQLRSGIEFGVDTATGKPGASGGNPKADPWIANAFDVSYEKYFGTRAYVSAAAFYKDLKSYIYTQKVDGYDFSEFIKGYTPPTSCGSTKDQQCPAVLPTGTFTAPFNGQGGKLSGVELAASLPLELVSPSLKGFGIQASASFTHSSIKIKDPESASSVGDGDIALPGLSKQVYNLTAYYEINGFEARISQRRRSDFIGEIGNFNGARTLRYVVGENITDVQVGYNFADTSSFKGLGLLFQVQNLTNAAYKTYASTKDRPLEYIKWGRIFLLGANYKF